MKTERVDDIPILLAQLERMGVQELLDQHFHTHGNWQGLSLGCVAVIWLSHILSQADHRLNQVQPWVESHLDTLSLSLKHPLRALDLSDDRLESVIRYLSYDECWWQFEQALSQRQMQVYDLRAQRVRLDSTTASGYWSVTPEGLFQYGPSKDHRPDLPQLKLMLSTLDPMGVPIATEIVSGNCADDPLYDPAVNRVRATLSQRGLLYVGDCKMASLRTRHLIHSGGDYYLCPLGGNHLAADELHTHLVPFLHNKVSLEPVSYEYANGTTAVVAYGYEQSHCCSYEAEGQESRWQERRLIVYSIAHAKAAKKGLQGRLEKTQTALEVLNQTGRGKKPYQDLASVQQAAETILRRHRVSSLFQLSYHEQVEQRCVRRYRDNPARVVEKRRFQVDYSLDSDAVEQQIQVLGWRVYVTNHPTPALSLSEAVVIYRQEYRIENAFGRFKGHPLSLTPMYLQREDHIKGLIRLLSIGLRLLTLLEYGAQDTLAQQKAELAGVYAGNPKRSTARPTAEMLLASFNEITPVVIEHNGEIYVDLTELTGVQRRILELLKLLTEIYTRLGPKSDEPP